MKFSLLFKPQPSQFTHQGSRWSSWDAIQNPPCTSFLDGLKFIFTVDITAIPYGVTVIDSGCNHCVVQEFSGVSVEIFTGPVETPEAALEVAYQCIGMFFPCEVVAQCNTKDLHFILFLYMFTADRYFDGSRMCFYGGYL